MYIRVVKTNNMSLFEELPVAVTVLYMLVSVGFVLEMVSCNMQTKFRDNMYAKHLITVLFIFTIVIIAEDIDTKLSVINAALLAVGVYAWFVLTTRTPFKITVVIVAMLFAAFVIHAFVRRFKKQQERGNHHRHEKQIHNLEYAQKIITVLALGLTIVGAILYYHEKRIEYKEKFSPLMFFVGKPKCREFTKYRIL